MHYHDVQARGKVFPNCLLHQRGWEHRQILVKGKGCSWTLEKVLIPTRLQRGFCGNVNASITHRTVSLFLIYAKFTCKRKSVNSFLKLQTTLFVIMCQSQKGSRGTSIIPLQYDFKQPYLLTWTVYRVCIMVHFIIWYPLCQQAKEKTEENVKKMTFTHTKSYFVFLKQVLLNGTVNGGQNDAISIGHISVTDGECAQRSVPVCMSAGRHQLSGYTLIKSNVDWTIQQFLEHCFSDLYSCRVYWNVNQTVVYKR